MNQTVKGTSPTVKMTRKDGKVVSVITFETDAKPYQLARLMSLASPILVTFESAQYDLPLDDVQDAQFREMAEEEEVKPEDVGMKVTRVSKV